MSLTLTQSGRTVSGSHTGGALTCTAPEGTFTDSLDGGPIRNGYLTTTDSIGFEVGGSGLRCTGVLQGITMLGTATITRDLGEPLGIVVLSGNWGAEVEGVSRVRDSILGPCVVPGPGPCAGLRR